MKVGYLHEFGSASLIETKENADCVEIELTLPRGSSWTMYSPSLTEDGTLKVILPRSTRIATGSKPPKT